MTFITYAQNFEDVMLWRALKHVESGFYIDVGAADPDEDSVTRAFYDRGWHGINIEPSPDHFRVIEAARPRDINLKCLVGSTPGTMDLYNISDTGLSTTDRNIADRHAADGRTVEVIRLQARTLGDISHEFAPPDVHFLKIDVEGAEKDVLRGADFAVHRPWIIVVEATEPMLQAENWRAWDPLLTAAGYSYVWFDGLNRFYLAAERADDLRHAFQTPPNVFDGWIRPRGVQQMALLNFAYDEAHMARSEAGAARVEVAAVRREAAAAQAEAATLRTALVATQREAGDMKSEAARLGAALAVAEQEVEYARSAARAAERDAASALLAAQQDDCAARRAVAELAALQSSSSWRITAPLRKLSHVLGTDPIRRERLREVARLGSSPAGVRGLIRIAVYAVGRALARVPGGRAIARLGLSTLPGPHRWVAAHYSVYRQAALQSAVMTGGAAISPESTLTDRRSILSAQCDLAAEEQAMLLRLCPRNESA